VLTLGDLKLDPTNNRWGVTMPTDLWAPYVPDEKQSWNLSRVAHLHRRAAFGGTWPELHRDLADGPEKAVARLLAGNGQPARRERLRQYLGAAVRRGDDPGGNRPA